MNQANGGVWRPEAPQHLDVTQDAVIVVPGIMGSELRDAETDDLLWGLKPAMLRRFWGGKDGLEALHVTAAELGGSVRVRPSELLCTPAWAPVLNGFEPYGELLKVVKGAIADRRALLPFPYDWRLKVQHTGRLLAIEARQHLEAWTATVQADPALRGLCDDRMPQLVFVAHSMGGLVVRAALDHDRNLLPDTRAVLTLGTPFLGSVKAAVMLNGGRRWGGTRGKFMDRLQKLAATLPGLYDLLPDYRCVDEGQEILRLTPTAVAAIGGDSGLARAAAAFQAKMRSSQTPSLPCRLAVVGVAQETVQSIRIENGVVHPQNRAFLTHTDGELRRDRHGIPEWYDRWGDGTVYRDAASNGAARTTYLPVQHGALAKDKAVLHHIHAVLTERDDQVGPPMAHGLGLVLPDEGVVAGETWTLRLTGSHSPIGISCHVVDTETGLCVAQPRFSAQGEGVEAPVTISAPGLYRIEAQYRGGSIVTQLILAFEPQRSGDG